MAGVFRLNNLICKRLLQSSITNIRAISTTKKNNEVGIAAPECKKDDKVKNWVSYGFDFKNEAADKSALNSTFFFAITLCVICGGFVWTYIPDYQLRDWAQREAYLEIRRREKDGLALLDPNLVDPANVTLPEDDELDQTEIII